MPFTPFHFGVGAFAQSLTPRYFSFRAFVLSQVVIDCETAWNLYRGHEQLHAFFHTYLGAPVAMTLTGAVIAVYSGFASRFPGSWLVSELSDWGKPFELRSSLFAILFGGWSHVFLDSVMHEDIRPLAPFSSGNSMLEIVSLEMLHLICLGGFIGAGLLWGARTVVRSFRRGR